MNHYGSLIIKQRRGHSKWLWVSIALLALIVVYLIRDYYGPELIFLEEEFVNDIPALRTKGEALIVQDYDSEGNLWATRGMWAYQLKPGESQFVRQYHIPIGFSIYWLRNFSLIRSITLRPECVELFPFYNGEVLAMSAGRILHSANAGKNFKHALALRHYGIWTGPGFRNDGLARLKNGSILFGEYFVNKQRGPVHLYGSNDNGRNWQVVYKFQPSRIRHVHAVQQDPFSNKTWILTGDRNHESMVAWTSDGGKMLNSIGQGKQRWRVTQLVFTPRALFWGADTGHPEESGIYKWQRDTRQLSKIAPVAGNMFYATRLAEGLIVMSTNREGTRNEKDDKTRLWLIDKNKEIISVVFGSWDNRRKYAKLRFQRTQGHVTLAVTVLNHKKYNNELLIFTEKSFRAKINATQLKP